MRLIDADALDAVVTTADYWHDVDRNKTWWLIYRAPTIEAEPVKHGRWNYTPDYAEYCSECGGYPDEEANHHYDYCPLCGARMDGDYGEEKPE